MKLPATPDILERCAALGGAGRRGTDPPPVSMHFRETAPPAPPRRRPPITSDVDLVGEWIRLREAGGSRLQFPVGILRRGATEPDWIVYDHRLRDGMGGIMHALQQAGYRIRSFPQHGDPSPPSPLAIRLAVLRNRWTSRHLRTHPWTHLDTGRRLAHGGQGWFLLSREQTTALRAFARARGVSLGTLLFWSANRTIPGAFARDPAAPRTWVVTRNMRGPLRLRTEFGNLSASMDVRIPQGASLEALEHTIRRELRLNAHWVRWYWTWRFGSVERMRAFHERWPHVTQRFRTGAFSNAGEFPRDYVEPTEQSGPLEDIEGLILGGATGPIHPIGCLPASWNGRLSLSLCLAAQLADDVDTIRGCLARWVEDVLTPVERVDAAAVRDGVRALSWDALCAAARARY